MAVHRVGTILADTSNHCSSYALIETGDLMRSSGEAVI
jgi:hypothetical protein